MKGDISYFFVETAASDCNGIKNPSYDHLKILLKQYLLQQQKSDFKELSFGAIT
jgi:hypothetical protein